MKALITGANGFVGTYLAEELIKNNFEVVGTKLENETVNEYMPKNVNLLDLDLCNKSEIEKIIEEIQPDYIYHLAALSSVALSWKNPQLTVDVNVNGTLNLLEAVRKVDKKVRVLMIGSSEQYGLIDPKDIPITEEHRLAPNNPYAASKAAQEQFAMLYAKSYNMDIVFTRSFNHVGPRQSDIFVVSDFAKRLCEIEKGVREPKLLVGNLEAERDFSDVRDVVKAYMILMEKGKSGEVYNVGSGKRMKVQEILDKLVDNIKTDVVIERDSNRMRPSDNPIIQCDNRKMIGLEWYTCHDINDTILDVIAYWRNKISE